jgi:hypothetical protein
MKQLILTLTLLLFALTSSAQYFEGMVVYRNTYKSKSATVTDQQYKAMFGSTLNWYIQNGCYKSDTDGSFFKSQLYIHTENRIYSKLASSDKLLYDDASYSNNPVLSSKLHKNVATILGYRCDELILNTKAGVQRYYFTHKLPINGKLYQKHKYGNWSDFLNQSNAVPLQMVIEMPQMVMTSIANQVKPMKLNPTMFTLPNGVQVVKNPNR